ncbi:MAG: dienelactone hydrolase, partial [Alphaproteobacteria bacterium]|nr:dienelactone hydrolase [Alphaproteobacteria bacterium]
SLPQLCRSQPGFDRAAFHQSFNREVVRFFRETL